MVQYLDYSWSRPTQEQLAPYAGVLRYLETGGSRPDLTLDEVKALHSWGKKICLIWEKGASDATSGFAGGAAAAMAANAEANKLGAPQTVPIFYTVDSDLSATVVKPYFDGIRSIAGRPVGIYGSFALMEWAATEGIPYRWQALGWAYNHGVSSKVQLHQATNNVSLGSGVTVDIDDVLAAVPTWDPPAPATGGAPVPSAYDFLKVAASQIGYREGRDANGNWNNINKYGAWYGSNGVAWCAQFVSWCANEVGALNTLVPKYQSTFAGLTWFRKRDLTGVWPPQAGDIFMMCEYNPGSTFDTGNGWATVHTGIVERYLGQGKIQTIEGNTNTDGSPQGNGVYRLTRQDSPDGKRFIYARPRWGAAVTGGAGTGVSVPAPAPAPVPTPSYPRGEIRVANLKKGLVNADVARLRAALYDRFGDANDAHFQGLYGSELAKMVEYQYNVWGKTEAGMREKPGEAPWDEPGAEFLKRIGFKPV